MLTEIQAIPNRTISVHVYQELRQHILGQTFIPGQRLQVDDLCQQLGVSRTPVKDAINMLAAEGLIKIVPRRGTFVAELSVQEIKDTYDVRRALELAAAERLIRSATTADLQALESIIVVPVAASDADVAEHLRRNFAFHELFIQLSGNLKLLEIYRSLDASLQIARIHYRSSNWRNRVSKEYTEHLAIVDALRERDARALEMAIRAHLDRAKQSLVDDMVAVRRAAEVGGG